MKPRVDHIHITVEDLGRAEKFYDRLLPLLGFDTKLKETDRVPGHEYKIIEYHFHRIGKSAESLQQGEAEPEEGRGAASSGFSC